MDIKRRNFIQFASLGLTTVLSGFRIPDSADADLDAYTNPLSIQMDSPQGKYIFYVDGKKQTVNIVDGQGQLFTPAYSCEIKYLASDGETNMIVNIDQETKQLRLLPGLSETYSEILEKP
jgi:hypothetical protein